MPKQPFRNPVLSNIFIWLLVFIIAWAAWNFLVLRRGGKVETIDYSQFITELNNDNIKSVVFTDKEISGSLRQESYKTSDKNRIKYREFKTTQPSLKTRIWFQNLNRTMLQ
jgi:ATP-dependent Zn protease